MLSYLQFSEDLFGPLRLFQFISVRSIMAGITALFIGFWAGPRVIRFLQNLGARQAFREKEEVGELADLHENKAKTPTMGGLLIFVSVSISVLLWAEPNVYVITALVTYLILTCVGFADDFLKSVKEEQQGTAGALQINRSICDCWVSSFILLGPLSNTLTGFDSNAVRSNLEMREIWFPFYSYDSPEDVMKLPVIAVFILFLITMTGSSNAINLTDGLDGLAIGCTVTVALTYAVMAYASGNFLISEYLKISWVPGTGELTIVCTALLGGSLAFLWFNAHPAEMFMGIPVPWQ